MTPQKVILIVVGLIVLFISGWYITGCPGASACPFFKQTKVPPKKVNLSFIGPWDYQKNWEEIAIEFNKYKRQEENGYLDVNINFERIEDQLNYEDIFRERQFDGKGPNIFMIFHTWVPRYESKISKVPPTIMNLDKFKNTYARAAVDDLTKEDGTIFALPFYIDTLALYYNEAMFLNEGMIEAPKNWQDFQNYVEKLTILKFDKNTGITPLDKDGNPMIDVAGAAFGGGTNVNRSQDMLMLLVMQNNYDEKSLISFKNNGSRKAVQYYIDFTNPNVRYYTWNKNEIYSIDAFTQRRAAMMINYSSQIENIENKTGRTLSYKVAPIPQLDENKIVNYASYWVPVVAKKAPCSPKIDCEKLSWEFLSFASKKPYSRMYLDSTNRAAANLEIAKEQSLMDDKRSVFAKQVFTARTWKNKSESVSDLRLQDLIDNLNASDKSATSVKKEMAKAMKYINEINQ